MVITNDLDLPTFEELEEEELNLSSATLMAAGPYVAKNCEGVSNEFMLCRLENNNPIPCIDYGKLVTRCYRTFLSKMKKNCLHEFDQYTNCIDKSSGSYKPWFCRKTHAVLEECVREKLCIDYPGFGYFARGRVHKSACQKQPPEPPCPCLPKPGEEATASLPDCKDRPKARFTARSYYMTE